MEAERPQTAWSGLASLGLPLRERRSAWLATLALLAYYALTLARDLSLYDSGELALAAVQLGLGHPPGQPLHTLLGYAFAQLPLAPLTGVALASAVPAALTVLPATSYAEALAGSAAPSRALRMLPWLIACTGVHAALWEPATRVEVYALSSFFAVWAFARLAHAGASEPRPAAHVLQAGIALGLCASANPMIALCTGAVLAPGILVGIARGALPFRALGYALLGGALGLVPYAYVLVTAHRDDVFVWGAPRDAASLWHYLALRDYVRPHTSLALWATHFAKWWPWAATQQLVPLLALGAAGQLALGRDAATGRAAAPLLLLLLIAVISYNFFWHLDVPDYNGYVATGLWLLAAGAAAFCANALAQDRRAAAAALAAALVISAFAGRPHVLARTRSRDHLARVLSERVLREAPRDAIVIAREDHFAGSFFYLQQAERARPDVVVLAYGLTNSRWHWQQLFHDHPGLAAFELQGGGGRAGRIRRFLARQGDRPLLLEDHALAHELGLRACAPGLFLRADASCAQQVPPDPAVPALLARQLALLDQGSPGADGAIAMVAYKLGESQWLLGEPRAAFATLLAGVPRAMQPAPPDAAQRAALARAPALPRPMPLWRRGAALGDPARNLFLAGAVLAAAGERGKAFELVRAAADDGLPEAIDLLARAPL
jgi:hypothetical protein